MIIGVMSTVGGAGTTFVATNIAAWAAQTKDKTVITEWGQDSILDALYMREKSLNRNYPTTLNYKQASAGEHLLKTPYGLTVLPGSPDCSLDDFTGVITILRDMYNLIVVDLNNHNPINTKSIIEFCDLIHLVIEPTNECMQSLTRYHELLINGNYGKINLIINKTSSQSYYHPRDMARYLNIEEYTVLPYEPRHINRAAANRQQLVYHSKGKCGLNLRKLAEKIKVVEAAVGAQSNSNKNKIDTIMNLTQGKLKQPITIIDLDTSCKLAYKFGLDISQLWQHDWRIGVSASPAVINKKVHFYCTNIDSSDEVENRDIRCLKEIIELEGDKKRQIILYLGARNDLLPMLSGLQAKIITDFD